ncbi:IclR family transcriptional regulator [Enemella evansiae]|uniref:IclR family transcriptional regulator n=1 Tax=Enemella evansiae TaxID=2016499 RepID=UPI000B96D5D9|nr:IclR family transcriptional regulator C-terminal domain-containing protein [Enemella evansiae]OYN98693.1 transcriptional regulator [Enemella evansiae]OYN98816.1 transcriptional regulator [Enemella evansiae]OYO13893.1 transcriptional regulator [Enemella evansiae]OYO18479.1 transcriptional regulator [Enemella evansiae]
MTVRATTRKDRPSYALASVDNALRLAAMLQLEGELSVAEIAQRLEVAPSTAHRLARMLVYRDFAVQGADRRYGPGRVLAGGGDTPSLTARLREASLRPLALLTEVVQETSHLMILVGGNVRFLASAESPHQLHVGTREGMLFTAHRTAGGMMLLSELSDEEALERCLETGDPVDPDWLRTELAKVRRAGIAMNRGRSERGVTAFGRLVRTTDGVGVAAVTVALPTTRYNPACGRLIKEATTEAVRRVEAGLRSDSLTK